MGLFSLFLLLSNNYRILIITKYRAFLGVNIDISMPRHPYNARDYNTSKWNYGRSKYATRHSQYILAWPGLIRYDCLIKSKSPTHKVHLPIQLGFSWFPPLLSISIIVLTIWFDLVLGFAFLSWTSCKSWSIVEGKIKPPINWIGIDC